MSLPFDEPAGAAALHRSGGGGPSGPDLPHRQLGSGLWAFSEPRLLHDRSGDSHTPAGPVLCSSSKERPFLNHWAHCEPQIAERRERLVRLTGWGPRRKSSNRLWPRGRGSERRTPPPTSARSARSSRWSTACSRSRRGFSCPTLSSGRGVLGSSRLLRARRFPSDREQPARRRDRSGEVAGAGRCCSRDSCLLQARPPAASSAEGRRRFPGRRSRLRARCGRQRGRQTRARSPSPSGGRLAAECPSPLQESSRAAHRVTSGARSTDPLKLHGRRRTCSESQPPSVGAE